MRYLWIFLTLVASEAAADIVIATRTIRPQQIITMQDVRLDPQKLAGAHETLDVVVGREAKVAIYPGRAVMRGHVGAPALVARNQIVEVIYSSGGLRIVAEGRALGRAAVGERIRVMNLSSRSVLFGTVAENGTILVVK